MPLECSTLKFGKNEVRRFRRDGVPMEILKIFSPSQLYLKQFILFGCPLICFQIP
jgi:hypothetical protein